MSEPEEHRFCEAFADQLQSDGQAVAVETDRNGDGGKPG